MLPSAKGFTFVCFEETVPSTTPIHLVNCLFNPGSVKINDKLSVPSVFWKFLDSCGNFDA